MNNLINEEDFLPKVYNPKRWFGTFYLTAIAIAVIILLLFKFVIPSQSNVWTIFYGVLIAIIIPFSLSLAMVLTKKEILLDTNKSKLATAIFIVQICYLAPRIFNLLYSSFLIYLEEGNVSTIFFSLLGPFAALIITYIITLAVAFLIINRSRKIKDHPLPQ